MNSTNPESCYPSPSPSSHASSILRAVLKTPTPSPEKLAPIPGRPAPVNLATEISGSVSLTGDLRSPHIIVYHLYGLDDSTIGSSDNDDAAEPAYKHLEPLVFLPLLPAINTITSPQETRESVSPWLLLDSNCLTRSKDVFGPVRVPPWRTQCYDKRRAKAELAARIKLVRTAAWVRRVCRDTMKANVDIY